MIIIKLLRTIKNTRISVTYNNKAAAPTKAAPTCNLPAPASNEETAGADDSAATVDLDSAADEAGADDSAATVDLDSAADEAGADEAGAEDGASVVDNGQ